MLSCFGVGVLWSKYELLDQPVILTEPLLLQEAPGAPGSLPEGTVLYPYTAGPSTTTYVVFVNTKNTNVLELIKFDRPMTVSPVSGYAE